MANAKRVVSLSQWQMDATLILYPQLSVQISVCQLIALISLAKSVWLQTLTVARNLFMIKHCAHPHSDCGEEATGHLPPILVELEP